MARSKLLTIVALALVPLGARAGELPVVSAIPYAKHIKPHVLDEKLPAKDRLQKLAAYLAPLEHRYRVGNGLMDLTTMGRIVAAVINLEYLTEGSGEGAAEAAAMLVPAYFHLLRFAENMPGPSELRGYHERYTRGTDERFEHYFASIEPLRRYARERFVKASDARFAADADDAQNLKLRGKFHERDLDLDAAATWYRRLAKASTSGDAALPLVRVEVARLSEKAAKKRLVAFLKKHPDQRLKMDAVLYWRERVEAWRKARKALAASDTAAHRLDLIAAEADLLLVGSPLLRRDLAAARKKYPTTSALDLAVAASFTLFGDIEFAVDFVESVPPETDPELAYRYAGLRAMTDLFAMYRALVANKPEVLAERSAHCRKLLERAEKDSPFSVAIGRLFVEALEAFGKRRDLIDKFMKNPGADARKELVAILNPLFAPLRKKWKKESDIWKVEGLRLVSAHGEAVADHAGPFVKQVTRSVAKDQRNPTDLFLALALMTLGRKKGHERLQDDALARLEALRKRWIAHYEKRRADLRLAVERCPPGGCVYAGTLYAYLGGLRNIRRGALPEARQPDWDRDTARLMDEGMTILERSRSTFVKEAAMITTHKCFALLRLNDNKVYECFGQLSRMYYDLPITLHWHAALLALANRGREAAVGFERVAANAQVSETVRYDAYKWLASIALATGDTAKVKEYLSKALERRKAGTGNIVGWGVNHVTQNGSFNVGIGWGAKPLVHQVDIGLETYSIPTAPIDDARIEAFLKAKKE